MPLMVDESGRPVYANGPSVSVFGVTPTVMNAVPDQTSASNALISTTAATVQVTAQAAAHNYTPERIKDEQAIQAGLDSETPRNVMLAGMAFVVLIFVLAHPRFLARVLASARKPKKHLRRSGSDKSPNSATPLHQARPKLPIGGGDLRQGWLLRPGRSLAQNEPLANNVFLKEKFDDPFVSTLGYQPTEIADGAADAPVATPPPHIVPLHHHLPFSSSLLFAPFSWLPGSFRSSVTLAELFIILAYLVLVAFALIWRSDISPTTATKGYGYDFYRTGLVSLAHIPWAVGLGVRGNIVGLCVSKGHDKLKRLHKIVGRICFLAGTLHSVFYFHKFAVAGVTGKMVTKPFILAGLIAWVGLTVMAVTSIPQIRNKCYSLFKVCHIIGLASVLVGMCFHVKVAIPWCIAAASVYGVSILCSLTKTRLAHAELTVLPGSQTTLVTVPALRSGWRPGQHVRIRVPGLGLRHGFEGHPFTIASAPDGEGMVLMCKVAGDWTQKLYDFAASSPTFPGEKQNGETVQATIILEGPYGGLGNTMLPSFSGIVLASGGSGISHSLALAHDVVLRAHTGVIRARTVDLIWAVPTQEAAKPLMPTLIELVEDAKALEEKCLEGRKHRCNLPPPVALRVHIYITRCPVSSPILLLEPQPIPKQKASIDSFQSGFSDDTLVAREPLKRQTSDAEQMKRAYLQRNRSLNLSLHPRSAGASYYVPLSGIEVLAKRPDFDVAVNDIVEEVIDRANRERNDPSGVCVASCGPASLVSAVRDATRRVQGKKRRAVGGIDYEEEHFAY